MKNIHVLSTNKPSRLHYSKIKNNDKISYKLVLKKEFSKCNDGLLSGQRYIYITSDEEIKDNTWVLNIVNGVIYKTYSGINFNLDTEKERWRKIILTTDQDLIKDGVQEIDDEFLEWFVRNPTCEFINVDEKTPDEIEVELNIHGHDIGLTNREFDEWLNNGGQLYKIIIPKEEAKTNLEKLPFPELVKELAEYYKNIPLLEKRKEEPKQETLEEAKVNNLIKLFGKDFDLEPRNVIESCNDSFIEGSKWQQEQERNNENSWFNEYQKVEDYIIKRIGDKFLEATPDKYKTASEATIALLENNWKQEQSKNLYSEEEVLEIIDLLFHRYASSFRIDAKEYFLQFKKK